MFSGDILLANHPALILLVCAVLFMLVGWTQDGINLDSATYATIARHMAEDGRWFNPTYSTYCLHDFAEHPPLVMWAQAVLFLLLGATDATARIFGQICTVGSILAVYYLGCEVSGKKLGFLAGLVLLLTYNFGQIGNSTLLDVPMTFFVLLSLVGLVKIQKGDRSIATLTLSGLALAASFLAKGVVAGPVYAAFALSLLLTSRQLVFSRQCLWLWLGLTVPLGAYFLLDYRYADSHFLKHYFLVQVGGRYAETGPEIHTDWWEFSWRFVGLYVPFTLILPFGIYAVIKRRLTLLLPTLFTLALYWILYSTAAKLYYHYFCPAYALSALLVAVPIAAWLSDKVARRIILGFFLLWILLALAVTAAGVRVHEIRTREIYSMTAESNRFLATQQTRDGLLIGDTEPSWDYIAKAAWYWRSNLKPVSSMDQAMTLAQQTQSFSYMLVPADRALSEKLDQDERLHLVTGNDKLRIYSLTSP